MEILLNRYWDDSMVPRQESWREDYLTAEKSGRNKIEMYKHLRAGAESGIDFSSRWFVDHKIDYSIQTTDVLPVDLNSLMYHLEWTIAKARQINGDYEGAKMFREKAIERGRMIDKYFWNEKIVFLSPTTSSKRKPSWIILLRPVFIPFVFSMRIRII